MGQTRRRKRRRGFQTVRLLFSVSFFVLALVAYHHVHGLPQDLKQLGTDATQDLILGGAVLIMLSNLVVLWLGPLR